MTSAKKNGEQKHHKKKIWLLIILLAIAVTISLIWSIISFYSNKPVKRSATISLEFTYEEAAQNKMPNGEPFTISGIERDDVITAALTNLEYQDDYTPEQIRNSMTIRGSFPSDVISRISQYDSIYDFSTTRDVQMNNYYPTVYVITLYDDFDPDVSAILLRDILRELASEYKKYFMSHYTYVYSDSTEEYFSIENADYRQQLELIRGRMQVIEDYASYLYKEDNNFFFKGMNFNDLVVKCDDIENTDLTGLEAIIMMKAYSKNPDRLKKMYQYQISLLENKVKRLQENLEEVDALRDSYETDAILYVEMGDSYVKVDSNSYGTYEDLTSKKISLNDSITRTNAEISKLKEYLSDLNNSSGTSADIESVETKISTINTKIGDLENTLLDMIKAFNDYKITEDKIIVSSVNYVSPSLFSTSFLSTLIKYSIPTCLIAGILFGLYMIKIEKKKLA